MKPLAELIGDSPGIEAVRETLDRLLRRPAEARRLPPVLIQGETGTGKGLLARAIHAAGPRQSGPFVDLNCAAIPETLLEAELFGFERGAFTDARQAKPGLFQTAHQGTIFLDEIGLLPLALQSKLLTVIEDRAVRRLGSTRPEPADAWVLTATNTDLATATREGRFREDLYHRLAVVTVHLPPLRERGEDILRLADHFLARACADYDLPPKALAPDAHAALSAYRWPGNIRELANAMERVALLTEARLVTAEMLSVLDVPSAEPGRTVPPAIPGDAAVDRITRERDELLEALRATNWNVSRAAARLGIPRNTVRYRMDKHGLRPEGPPRAPRRRPVTRPAAPAPRGSTAVLAASPPPGGVRWEQRRLALLRATLALQPGTESSPDAGRALEALVEKVQSFGGRVEEMSPTGLVAVFGLEPAEDAPRRAANTAMAIQKATARVRGGASEPPTVRLGIHAGQFLVGHVGGAPAIDLDAKREAWSVLGSLVAEAQPGTILISHAAAPLLERRFDLAPVDPRAGAPGRAYRLAGLERAGFGLGGPFVGRSHDLALLHSRLASAQAGRGQVVGIGGEAGIGKSRLLFEFRQGLAEARVTYLEGHCYSYGNTIPYLAVLDLLRGLCGIADTDAPDAIAEKVRLALQDAGVAAGQGARYLLRLLAVREGPDQAEVLSPEAIKTRTFETLRQLLLNRSRRQPLVLAVENLHWIDTTSEEFLASLVESLAGAPILLLVTYRPGYRPPWLEMSYATQVPLQPVTPEDSLRIVHAVFRTEQVPDALSRMILRKAEGNPFFLEELSRTVVEHGHLHPTLAVPDTIQEVLLTRIERLPEEPRRLLQTASVLGREVPLRLLTAIWDGSDALASPLRELTRLEFLYEQSGGKEPVYVFKHALTREVARESVPIARRVALHAAAGRALESLYAGRLEEAYDRLAYHYSKGKQPDKAVGYLTRFAEKAARSYAHVEAVTALTEALGHVDRLPADQRERCRLELTLRQVHSLSFLGRFPDILDLLRRREADLGQLEAPSLAGLYHFWLAHTYSHLGDQEQAVQWAERALAEAEKSGDHATMGKAYVVLAQECYWSGQPLRGVEHGRRAVDLLDRTEDRWWLGLAQWLVGINYIVTGDFERALEAEAQALATGEAIGDPRIQSYATWSTGWIHALRGEWESGIEPCQRGLELAPDPVNAAVALGHLGYVYLAKGDPTQAIPLLEQAVAQVSQFGFQYLTGRFAAFLGEAHLLNDELRKARDVVSQALFTSREARYWYAVGWAQLALGRIALADGNLPEAEARLGDALETFTSIQAGFMAGRAHLGLVELARARADREAAGRHLAEAYRLFKPLRVPKYEEWTKERAAELGVPLAAEAEG